MRFPATLTLILASLTLSAQDTLRVVSYGVDEGLPQSSVWSTVQDDFGFLWIATADGLSRFDGYTFHRYEGDTTTNTNATRILLFKDSNGDLWLAHFGGVEKYNSLTGKFNHVLKLKQPTLTNNRVVGEDKNGNIWVAISGDGLYSFNKNGKQLGHFSPDEPNHKSVVSTKSVLDKDGVIWIPGEARFLMSFNTVDKKFARYETPVDVFTSLAMNDNTILLTARTGIVEFTKHSKTAAFIPFNKKPESISPFTILEKSPGVFWIGTDKGVYEYDAASRTFPHKFVLKSGINRHYSYVYELYKDQSNNIWLGTNGDGLKKYPQNIKPFRHYTSMPNNGELVKSIYADGKDRVYIGYYDNGLDVFSQTKGLITKLRESSAPSAPPTEWVYSITPFGDDQLFLQCVGTRATIGLLNTNTFKFKSLQAEYHKQSGLTAARLNDHPAAISLSKEELLFNDDKALIKLSYDFKDELNFEVIHEFDQMITSIYRDSKGTLWVGTVLGFNYKKANEDKWHHPAVAADKMVKTFCEDTENNVWVGTINGIFVVSPAGQLVNEYKVENGLPNDFVYGILKDNRGDLWFSHNRGLSRYESAGKTFKHYSAIDGLQSNEFNTGAYYKSATGELFFGGIYGTNSFYPQDIRENAFAPKVHITEVRIFDRLLDSDSLPWTQRHIELDHDQNSISIEFAALEYTAQIKNQYRYRLKGVDKDWVDGGHTRSIRYANLSPGDYTFEVMASNNDGLWTLEPAVVNISIVPPYWATNWFRALMAFVVVGIAVLITLAYSRKGYASRVRELEDEQRTKRDHDQATRELLLKSKSELHALSSTLEETEAPQETDDRDHQKTLEFTINVRQMVSEIRAELIELEEQQIGLFLLSSKLRSGLRKVKALFPAVKISFTENVDETTLTLDEALGLLYVCEEAICNAIRLNKCTTINIKISSNESGYRIEIEDNGGGFLMKKEEGRKGLESMEIQCQEIGASLGIYSSPGTGTRISISKEVES